MTSAITTTSMTPSASPSPPVSRFAGQRVHMIGIGGCGMSGLADVLIHGGAVVTGTDRLGSEMTDRLAGSGATIEIAAHPGPLPDDVDLVVASAAVADDHPQRQAALSAGCRVIKYAQLLGELMSERVGMAVAGTHGKSTTTAWTTFALRLAGLDPTYVVGAQVPQLGAAAAVGDGPHFVAEACEYDRSFHHLNFHYAVVLNVEEDHLDYYRDAEDIEAAFTDFARRLTAPGMLLVNGDDAPSRRVAERADVPFETFGFNEFATWRAVGLESRRGCFAFDLQHNGHTLCRATLQLAGRHHVFNALATAALAHHAGVEPEPLGLALSTFEGASRRLTCKGTPGGITILDDYAHHPTEIRATLQAARDRYRPRKLWAVFQPHQHSRTRRFLDEFARSFSAADEVIVPDIYFVRDCESERERVEARDLVECIRRQGGSAQYGSDFSSIVQLVDEQTEPGDVVITLGAGDIWQVADELANRLGHDH